MKMQNILSDEDINEFGLQYHLEMNISRDLQIGNVMIHVDSVVIKAGEKLQVVIMWFDQEFDFGLQKQLELGRRKDVLVGLVSQYLDFAGYRTYANLSVDNIDECVVYFNCSRFFE